MKKKRLIIALAAAVILSAAALAAAIAVPQPTKNYTSMQEMYEDKYENIKMLTVCSSYGSFNAVANKADTIVVVRADDELTAQVSSIHEAKNSHFSAASRRSVTTLEAIKNEGVTEITDLNGLKPDGTLYVEENCWPMLKDGCYIVFLEGGKTIGWRQGKIDLTNLRLNDYENQVISVLAQWDMLEFTGETDKAAEVLAEFLEAEFIAAPYFEFYEEYYGGQDWQAIKLTTEYTSSGMEMQLEYAADEEHDRMLYRIDGLIYA